MKFLSDKAAHMLTSEQIIDQQQEKADEEVQAAVVPFDSKKHKHRLQSMVCKVLKKKQKMDLAGLFELTKLKMGL
jgi:hypothetical protein